MGVVENSKMPRAFSSDLQWRILWLYHYKELNYTTLADLLYVHGSTVSRVISRYNVSADVAPITDGPTRILRRVVYTLPVRKKKNPTWNEQDLNLHFQLHMAVALSTVPPYHPPTYYWWGSIITWSQQPS